MHQGSLSALINRDVALYTTPKTPLQIEGSLYAFKLWFTIRVEPCIGEWHNNINALNMVEEAQSSAVMWRCI